MRTRELAAPPGDPHITIEFDDFSRRIVDRLVRAYHLLRGRNKNVSAGFEARDAHAAAVLLAKMRGYPIAPQLTTVADHDHITLRDGHAFALAKFHSALGGNRLVGRLQPCLSTGDGEERFIEIVDDLGTEEARVAAGGTNVALRLEPINAVSVCARTSVSP